MKFDFMQIVRWVVGGTIIALLLSIILTSCKSQAPIVVPAKQTHIEQNDSTHKQYRHDSIYIDRWHTKILRGDTVYIHDSIYFHDGKTLLDTVYIIKTTSDTIPSDPVIIEKPLTNNQIFLQRSGIALWVLIALLLLAAIIGIIIKFAK